ncbi:MAG TPA: esterase-like activity of phytase family protein [Vicinamibacterales bacterium]|nr:esterase-like activity of phytase family protein [Vicinamibacterales bacterium]
MKKLCVALLVTASVAHMLAADPADPGVTLIGTGSVSGSATDLSGLKGSNICAIDINKTVTDSCIDAATLGGFGSAFAYTGHDNVFLGVPDRGPFDGRTDVPYATRFHFFHMTVDPSAAFPNITAQLLDTRFLMSTGNTSFVGDAYAFNQDDEAATRFDPEGARVDRDGNFYISDEYGPYIRKFNRQGHLLARITLPVRFLLDPTSGHRSGDINNPIDAASLELTPANNITGRQANRGMEGLAITPDGTMLVGIMQNALIQDNGLQIVADNTVVPGRRGLNNRIVTVHIATGETHAYVYTVDAINQGRGVNELVAINDHEFLVLERDNRTRLAGSTPNLKRIYRIDLSKNGLKDVTDISNVASLPEKGADLAALNITAVPKTLFIDMLKDVYKVDATHTIKDVIAEKMEALAWGPDLPDGRHVLYVLSDNDLNLGIATQIYAFAVDGAAAGITYVPQDLPEPMFPPGQVKKLVK